MYIARTIRAQHYRSRSIMTQVRSGLSLKDPEGFWIDVQPAIHTGDVFAFPVELEGTRDPDEMWFFHAMRPGLVKGDCDIIVRSDENARGQVDYARITFCSDGTYTLPQVTTMLLSDEVRHGEWSVKFDSLIDHASHPIAV